MKNPQLAISASCFLYELPHFHDISTMTLPSAKAIAVTILQIDHQHLIFLF